nr:uncharacterized protein LOC121118530 [Lepeophtheirus salmonis]
MKFSGLFWIKILMGWLTCEVIGILLCIILGIYFQLTYPYDEDQEKTGETFDSFVSKAVIYFLGIYLIILKLLTSYKFIRGKTKEDSKNLIPMFHSILVVKGFLTAVPLSLLAYVFYISIIIRKIWPMVYSLITILPFIYLFSQFILINKSIQVLKSHYEIPVRTSRRAYTWS